MNQERRHFHRVTFNSDATLETGGESYTCTVHDLCLQGGLCELKDSDEMLGGEVTLSLPLAEESPVLVMQGSIAHQQGRVIGIHFQQMALETISHLRRLVELNLGDPELLNRDFTALAHHDEA